MTKRSLPPLNALRAFEAAARHHSMTRAADELSVTPGAISRQVRELEDNMKVPLFLRRAKGLELTNVGETLAEELGEIFDRIAEATRGVRLRRPRRLSVGVYGYFTSSYLLPRWSALQERLPEIKIDLHTSRNPLDLIPSRYDAVIAVSDGTPKTGLVTHRLIPISTVPVCAPELLADGSPDFAQVQLLHARPRPDDWRRWLDHAGFRSVSADGGSSFESTGLAIEAAMQGLGFTMAIEALIRPEIQRGTLVLAHPKTRPTKRWFVLQHQSRLNDDPELRAFTEWLLHQIDEDNLA